MKKGYLLFLGAGKEQESALIKAKEMNIKTIAIDVFNWLPVIFMLGLSGSLSHRYVSKIPAFSEPAFRKSVYLWQSTQNICR